MPNHNPMPHSSAMSGKDHVTRAEVEPRVPAPTSPRARLALVVSLNFPDMNTETAELVSRFTRVAWESVHQAGAAADLFDTSTPLAEPAAVAGYDGLLVLGGGDVSPDHGGHGLDDVPHSYGVDRRADDDTLAAIRAAIEADKPVLGICRGSQLLNISYGGTVIADIDDFALHRGGPGEPMFLDEDVTVIQGTRLASVLGAGEVRVRSGHHQAVDLVGNGLRVAAVAHDGLVEAIEDPTRWVIGVQWHPEDDDGDAEHRRRLFAGFVDASQQSAAGCRRGGAPRGRAGGCG
jgi:putative glutamine amidotransferase